MHTPKLAWYPLSRDELPAVAFGEPVPRARQQGSSPLLSLNPNIACSVGFPWEQSSDLDYITPVAFVLHGQNIAETLSWLRVYAREAFPLSQFGRVISIEDWEMITGDQGIGRSFRDDRWASVALGELLAQSEHEVGLDMLPLSRALACFSTAIARTQKIYDSYEASKTCTNRLRAIEADARFVRRSITVDALVPIWAVASASFGPAQEIKEAAEFIISAASAADARNGRYPSDKEFVFPVGLSSDSIEERVIEFQRVAITAASQGSGSSNEAAAIIAAGAFMVGRGTSHAFLIKKFSRAVPLANVWFGLLAGILGTKFWDPAWARALKGVEKHIRSSFSWSDPPLSDISWAEYNWVSNAVRGTKAFSGVPRQGQAYMSIEVLPGAACQMRLQVEEIRSRQTVAPTAQPPIAAREESVSRQLSPEVVAALEQLVKLSNQAKDILSARPSNFSPQPQGAVEGDLFTREEKPKSKKNVKRASNKPSKPGT